MNLDDVENQKILPSLNKDEEYGKQKAAAVNSSFAASNEGIRRRGRPAGSSRTNKRKLGVNQPRRTRARVGNRPAKLCEDESDVDTSSDKTNGKEESETGRRIHETSGLVDKRSLDVQNNETVENSESPIDEVIEQKTAGDGRQGELFDRVHGSCLAGTSNREDEKPERLEAVVDPIQAMLLDMIPSLGTQKVGSSSGAPEIKEQPSDPDQVPVKKKKVSYKELVGDLLKDW